MQTIKLIAAISRNGVIGKDGKIPWKYPKDMKRFTELTTGHTVVMGRRTWENLNVRPLPHRHNIVIASADIPGVETVCSLSTALSIAPTPVVWIIGGARLYAEAAPLVSEFHITRVPVTVHQGDTFFPDIDLWTHRCRHRECDHSGLVYSVYV